MATQASTPNRMAPLIGGILMNFCLGTSYAWSVFVLPLESEFGWTRTETSITFTIIIISVASWFIVAGRLQDRMNPRPIAALGGILFGMGFLLGSMTTSLPWLYIAFGAMIGAGNGFGYAITIPVISKWYPDKRGLALGVVIGGYGLAAGVWGPIAGNLIPNIGWQATFRLYGFLFLGITMIGAWLLKNPPEGYRPPGWDPAAQAKTSGARSPVDVTTSDMLRKPTFYFLWIAYMFGSAAGLMLISQLVPFGRQVGIVAVTTIGLVAGAAGNMTGRVLSGWMSDPFGRGNTLRLMMLISAVAMPLLYMFGGNVLAFSLGVFAVYYCFGTLLSVFAATSADFYGTKFLGMNYGLLFLAWGVSALVGPPIGARVFDAFGNYQYAFFTASAMSLIAIASMSMAKTPGQE